MVAKIDSGNIFILCLQVIKELGSSFGLHERDGLSLAKLAEHFARMENSANNKTTWGRHYDIL